MLGNHHNKYVGAPCCRAEMYVGRVACCPLVSYGEYADGTDRQTDIRQTVALSFPLDAATGIRIIPDEVYIITEAHVGYTTYGTLAYTEGQTWYSVSKICSSRSGLSTERDVREQLACPLLPLSSSRTVT